MSILRKIYADFQNSDIYGRVRLITNGSLNDIKNQNIELYSGLQILLDNHDGFIIPGVVQYSEEEKIWVAIVNMEKLNE